MEACRARSEPRELERANLGRRRPSVLDAGACQHCVTLSAGRRSLVLDAGACQHGVILPLGAGAGQQCVTLARHPGVVGRCPKKMKRTIMRNSSVGNPPPTSWQMVVGGWGEL